MIIMEENIKKHILGVLRNILNICSHVFRIIKRYI